MVVKALLSSSLFTHVLADYHLSFFFFYLILNKTFGLEELWSRSRSMHMGLGSGLGFVHLLVFALFLLVFSASATKKEKSSRPTVCRSVCLSVCLSVFSLCGRPAPKASSEQGSNADKKERPTSTMSEASNYTGGSDCSNFAGSPATTVAATTASASSTRVSVHPSGPKLRCPPDSGHQRLGDGLSVLAAAHVKSPLALSGCV